MLAVKKSSNSFVEFPRVSRGAESILSLANPFTGDCDNFCRKVVGIFEDDRFIAIVRHLIKAGRLISNATLNDLDSSEFPNVSRFVAKGSRQAARASDILINSQGTREFAIDRIVTIGKLV